MSQSFLAYLVEDDPMMHQSIQAIVRDECRLVCFTSGEDCLAAAQSERPNYFMLDIGLPGMDGYTLCQAIKDDPALASAPITFVSSHDDIEARLKAYDAGGDDFIVKPFSSEELRRKLKVAKGLVEQRQRLLEQAESAEQLANLALASMDEAGLVLQFMNSVISWEQPEEIAQGLIDLLHRYRLEGVVQVRIDGKPLTLSKNGKDVPLEVSVVEHVRTLGRIFEFRTRGVHNFERTTLLINNLPVDDPDFTGRLRDNLSIAAQGADSRLRGLEAELRMRAAQRGILAALSSVHESVEALAQAQSQDQAFATQIIRDLQDSLVKSFVMLGLTADQERFVEGLVNDRAQQLLELLEHGSEVQEALKSVQNQLASLAST